MLSCNFVLFFQLYMLNCIYFLHAYIDNNIVSGPEELKEVIRESHVFEPPHMSEADFEGCILRVCRKLNGFMKHFSSVQRGTNPEKILESVFHCTDTMLHWSSQYPGELLSSLTNNLV